MTLAPSTFAMMNAKTPAAPTTGNSVQVPSPIKQPDFKQVDKNQDQKLTLEEFKAAGLSENYFKKVDTNSDGIVDMQEYLVAQAICC
jgi:hypothetical protein